MDMEPDIGYWRTLADQRYDEIERLREELSIARWDADVPIRELREEVVRLREEVCRLREIIARASRLAQGEGAGMVQQVLHEARCLLRRQTRAEGQPENPDALRHACKTEPLREQR